ncbi:MAG: SDR family oxidoreductase [Bacteroidia bacterium]|nr:SDR family oxidoreductase [Bacteroidia bacterium]MDW8235370.1 SDR family oxidoreductase [Bacteroidia bacterium]
MSIQIQGRVAWVTGASSGIGEALTRKLVAEGWNVAALARSEAPLHTLAGAAPDRILPLVADVRDYAACERAYAQILERFGRLDAVIANAGISHRATVEEVDLSVLREVMEVNFWGAVHVIKTALPEIKRQRGWIVGISSIAGFRGLPARSGYSASKFALNGFLEALRTELYGTGVKVLIAAPGFTRSAIRMRALDAHGRPHGETPLPEEKLMTAEEVAQHIYHAMLTGKKYLLLTTQGKLTVWLHRLAPIFMDRIVYAYFSRERLH